MTVAQQVLRDTFDEVIYDTPLDGVADEPILKAMDKYAAVVVKWALAQCDFKDCLFNVWKNDLVEEFKNAHAAAARKD